MSKSLKKKTGIADTQTKCCDMGVSEAGADRKTLANHFVGQILVTAEKGKKEAPK